MMSGENIVLSDKEVGHSGGEANTGERRVDAIRKSV